VFAVLYVNKTGVSVERILKFNVMEGHDAEHLTNNVINFVKDIKISVCTVAAKFTTTPATWRVNTEEF